MRGWRRGAADAAVRYSMITRKAEIKLTVELDGENMPSSILWQATDAESDRPVPCHSMMLSLWDSEKKSTAAIDLWIKDMTVEDMNLYFYQVFHKMADTYLRATKNSEVATSIHEFGDGFGNSLGLAAGSEMGGAS